jgi:methyl-accepting chemotaxis protein
VLEVSEATTETLDVKVIAERISEVVNKRLIAFDERIRNIEANLKRIEVEFDTLKARSLESIIRSVLSVKTDDVASTITSTIISEIEKLSKGYVASTKKMTESISEIIPALEEVKNALKEMKKLPKEVSEAIKSIKLEPEVDLTPIQKTVERQGNLLNELREGLANISNSLKKTTEDLDRTRTRFDEQSGLLTQVINGIQEVKDRTRELDERVSSIEEILEKLASVEVPEEGEKGGEEEV